MSEKLESCGPPRRRRKRRLPTASGSWSTHFAPTAGQWRSVEKAYGIRLDDSARAEIAALVKEYLADEPLERHAPFVSDALHWLGGVDRRARAFLTAIYNSANEAEQLKADAEEYARERIDAHLKHPLLGEREKWDAVVGIMLDVVWALKHAKEDTQSDSHIGIAEGEAWDLLVDGLSQFAERRGFPTSVSKGYDKTAESEPSAFVRMFRALQTLFPEGSRHQRTYMATAQAITEARRRRRGKNKSPRRSR